MAISLEELIRRMLEANTAIRDFSCRLVYVSDASEDSERREEVTGYCPPEPRITETKNWVKKPFKMRSENARKVGIFRKEGDGFLTQTIFKNLAHDNAFQELSKPRMGQYA